MTTPPSEAGFTLPELAITILLAALITSIAIPGLSNLTSSSKHSATVNEYRSAFSFARSKAVSTRKIVTLCPLSPSHNCTDQWEGQIAVFLDDDDDKRPDGDEVLRRLTPTTFSQKVLARTAHRDYFQFDQSGLSKGSIGSLVICTPLSAEGYKLTYLALSMGGRLRATQDENEDGKLTLPWGTVIHCDS
ncbi:hypothetical protein CF392_16130 [Tamilnaduibacter salinus]|uniref:Type II secretion system protein H n=1 Tax=Tamilnaduibacter salinus TaxID=1484056 RepID=A0A2A2HZD8_9GAMM|nr:GspH/FimT family pseudopilin [Tamilnaduibacter salinus]PAV24468.1 hypothetical protein CF392_16130 [Tamilnaduibacter salinus]